MANGHKTSGKQIISYASFCLGNLGHAAFYGVMSTYFIIFITSGMFSGLEQSVADKLIGLITGLMVLIRIVELVIDPILGNIVDNTKTKWGKFKPWIFIGTMVSAVLLLILFTGIFGLAQSNWILFAILFVIIYIGFDVFYSLSDVSYWGMVPALSEDSHERGIYTSLGAFSGAIGWNGLAIIVVPLVTGVTYAVTGKNEEGAPLAFAAVISALAIICQHVKKGDLLLEFDRDLALNNGYKDTIVTFYTQPRRIQETSEIQAGTTVEHGEKVVEVKFR